MTRILEKQIEDSFVAIRAEFKDRNNETGSSILDNIEEHWVTSGRLSDRQLAWLERQLDGSWKQYDAEPGKIVVDAESLDELEKAIDDLQRTVRAMR